MIKTWSLVPILSLEEVLIGEILAYGSGTVPDGYLECNGASLVRADYVALFTAIGTAWGTADGTHFNLPDLRGRFARGWANGQANDPDRATRTASNTGGQTGDKVGTVQTSAYTSHAHILDAAYGTLGTGAAGVPVASLHGAFNPGTGSAGGSETRPINAGVMFLIKY